MSPHAHQHPVTLIALSWLSVLALSTWSFYHPVVPNPVTESATTVEDKLNVEAILKPLDSSGQISETDQQLQAAQQIAKQRPRLVSSWIHLGDALAQKQRETNLPLGYSHAELAYQKAHQIEPQNTEALNGLAWVYGGRHDFQESVRWAKLALEIDPTHPISHGIIGDAALELGDLDRAAESYQAMMDARPDMSAYSRGAYLIWMNGDARKACWLMQKAIAMGSPHAENTAWCRTRLAMMLFHEGALLPAAQVADQGLKVAPNHVPLLLMQGKIKLAQKDEKAALAAFESVLKLGENHEALVGLGDLHWIMGRHDEAEKCFERVVKLHTLNAARGIHDHTQMARFYADHDRELDLALTYAEEHGQTQNVHEADTLAWVCYQKGDFKRARKAIEVAMRAGTPDAEIFYHAGVISAALKDKSGAKKLISRALSLNPRFHPIHAKKAVEMLDQMSQTVAAKN